MNDELKHAEEDLFEILHQDVSQKQTAQHDSSWRK
jgi:hypothetical protein